MRESKIKQSEKKQVERSKINFASYNPRKITPEAKKQLKANLKRMGLMGGIVWNEATGNLVSGHQRLSIIDEVNRYPDKGDYLIEVEVVHLSEKEEKEQNLFMNNRSVQGEFDDDMLRGLLDGIDYTLAGLSELDYATLMPDTSDFMSDAVVLDWSRDTLVDGSKELEIVDRASQNTAERRDIDRSVPFSEDSAENQLARHREIAKIQERIRNQNDVDKDNGAESYVVLTFDSPGDKYSFLEKLGLEDETKYVTFALLTEYFDYIY